MSPKAGRTERRALWLGFTVTIIVLLARAANVGEGMSLRSLDLLFWLRQPVDQRSLTPIYIVAIDNESFDNMPERWIWPRNFHAKLIRQIAKGRPRVIVFDILFTEATAADPKQDAALAYAARTAGCVIMGAEIVQVIDRMYRTEQLKLPFEGLRNSAYGTGIVNTPKDSDAFVRRGRLIWKVHDERHFSLPIEALRRYLNVGKGEINIEPDRIEFGIRAIPVDSRQQMLINFCGPPKTFRTIPYYQVYDGSFDVTQFRDAIVLIGATAEDLHDTFHTPFTWEPFGGGAMANMPGVEIHANTIDTIVRNRYIRTPSVFIVLALVVGMGMLVSWVAVRGKVWVSFVTALGASAALTGISVYLFIEKSQFLEFAHPLYAVWLSFLVCVAYRASTEMHEKRRVRDRFARYVSPHVLTTILARAEDPALGGARREATILFSDVRGFTSMSEKMDPHQVVEILNEYLTEMVEVVLDYDGTLDKFVGDAVMAVFGSPMTQSDHAMRAVSTAWCMHQKHNELKSKWLAEGKVPFEIGIGINTGDVVAGNIGSPRRMEYTVIGDNVNIAARLESATKEIEGAKVLISGTTYEAVRNHVKVKQHPAILVKGKAQPILVFELLGVDEEMALRLRTSSPAGKSKRK